MFTTGHGDHQTTWIMVDHGSGGVRYARVTESMTAGTVAVAVVGSPQGSTQVRVTYDLTSLSPAGETFDADYEAAIGDWATEIPASVQRPGGRDS